MDIRVLDTEKRRMITQLMSMNCNWLESDSQGSGGVSPLINVVSPLATSQRNSSLTDTVWLRSIQRTSAGP
ncbi:hypothetical protein D3C73_1548920 [compost metagenome]